MYLDGICVTIVGIVYAIYALSVMGLLISFIGILLTLPATIRIKKYSPSGTLFKNLLGCFVTGLKITIKTSLKMLTFFFSPNFVSWSIGYPVIATDKRTGKEVWLKPNGNGTYVDTSGEIYKFE